MRFNLRCGLLAPTCAYLRLPAPASLAGRLNSDVERLLSYVQFSKAKDSNRCLWRALHRQRYAQRSIMSSPVGARARFPSCGARASATKLFIVSSCSTAPNAMNPCLGRAQQTHLQRAANCCKFRELNGPCRGRTCHNGRLRLGRCAIVIASAAIT